MDSSTDVTPCHRHADVTIQKSPPPARAPAAAARPRGIDYSKWGHMDCSSDDEEGVPTWKRDGGGSGGARRNSNYPVGAIKASDGCRAAFEFSSSALAFGEEQQRERPEVQFCCKCELVPLPCVEAMVTHWLAEPRVGVLMDLGRIRSDPACRPSWLLQTPVQMPKRAGMLHVLSGGLEKAHAEEKGRGGGVGAVGRRGAADYVEEKDEQRREHLKGGEWERYVDGMAWILEHGGGEGREFRPNYCKVAPMFLQEGNNPSKIGVEGAAIEEDAAIEESRKRAGRVGLTGRVSEGDGGTGAGEEEAVLATAAAWPAEIVLAPYAATARHCSLDSSVACFSHCCFSHRCL
ncbi:unnamed protein product [Closterium sp. Naga37s-1]|nr:unnamed protein product [Closterium sp. Naga37s-1]